MVYERPSKACGKSYGLLSVLQKHQKFHEKKGDKTKIFTAPKGQRGNLSYIDFVEEEKSEELRPVQSYQEESFYREEQGYTYHVMEMRNTNEETESIAMDILGLLEDDQQNNDKPMEETLHKIF